MTEMKEARDPVVRYVGKIALKLHDAGQSHLVLRSSEPLPELDRSGARITFGDVAETLKVMCKLQQPPLDRPVEGEIELDIKGKPYVVAVRFEHHGDQSSITISLRIGPHIKVSHGTSLPRRP